MFKEQLGNGLPETDISYEEFILSFKRKKAL